MDINIWIWIINNFNSADISEKLPERANISPEEDWNFPGKNC